jgi:hypothetical protein
MDLSLRPRHSRRLDRRVMAAATRRPKNVSRRERERVSCMPVMQVSTDDPAREMC